MSASTSQVDNARAALQELLPGLRSVSARARKLLTEIADHTYDGKLARRSPNTAYLPELYDSCGVGVEEMYPLLQELDSANLIELEGQYPFEDVKIPATAEGNIPLADIANYCREHHVSLRDAIVEMKTDVLEPRS
jgi:hypothetical protein